MQDVGHQTDSGRVAASEQGGDENAPTASTSDLMSVADALALWARSENTPVSSFTLSQPPTAGRAGPSQSPAVDTVERDDAVNGNEEMLDSEQADDEDNGHYNFIVKLHARPYLGTQTAGDSDVYNVRPISFHCTAHRLCAALFESECT